MHTVLNILNDLCCYLQGFAYGKVGKISEYKERDLADSMSTTNDGQGQWL